MAEIVTLGLAGLAVFRLAWLVAVEDGPFDLFGELRARVGQTTWIGRGLHCPNCISFWLAAAAGAALAHTPRDFVLLWLGLAGAVLLLNRWLNGKGK